MSANKRVSHLAERGQRGEICLATPSGYDPFARAPLGWLKGPHALTGRVPEKEIALSTIVGNLTGRFIKGIDAHADAGDFIGTGYRTRRRPPHSQRYGRNVSRPARRARVVGVDEDDARAAAQPH